MSVATSILSVDSLSLMNDQQRRQSLPLYRELKQIEAVMAELAYDLDRNDSYRYVHTNHRDKILAISRRTGKIHRRNLPNCKECAETYFRRFWIKHDLNLLASMFIEVKWLIHLLTE